MASTIMFVANQQAVQPELWIRAEQVVSSAKSGFYTKLEVTLETFDFAAKVRALCELPILGGLHHHYSRQAA